MKKNLKNIFSPEQQPPTKLLPNFLATSEFSNGLPTTWSKVGKKFEWHIFNSKNNYRLLNLEFNLILKSQLYVHVHVY